MEVITPHLRVALSHEEFVQGHGAEFPEKYIIQVDGSIIKRTELPHGRHFQYKVPSLPTRGGVRLPKLEEEIAFLPIGKVPLRLFHQIVDFFKRVMTEMDGSKVQIHGALEAMAHIVWNPSLPTEYQVRIPTQKVGAASVAYEFDHLLAGDVIIVDIHSHNNMGAFFSGTDNNDDKKNTCYSGVIGKLGTSTPETKWRFNDLDHKIECNLDSIFEPEMVKCPDEWLTKVSKAVYSYQSPYQYPRHVVGGGRGATNLLPYRGKKDKRGKGRNGNTHSSDDILGDAARRLSQPGVDDDYYQGMFAGLGFGDSDSYMEGLMLEVEAGLDDLEKDGVDLGFSGVEASTNQKIAHMKHMITSGQLAVKDFGVVIPRFYQHILPTGVVKWADGYADDETGEDTLVTESEKRHIVNVYGNFMLYVEQVDLNIISPDISEESTPLELWNIFLRLEEDDDSDEDGDYDVAPYDDLDSILEEWSAIGDEAKQAAVKKQLMDFLKNGTSPMEKVLITAYLFNLYQAEGITLGDDSHVQVH
jgi:PRTRC genetic system protein A